MVTGRVKKVRRVKANPLSNGIIIFLLARFSPRPDQDTSTMTTAVIMMFKRAKGKRTFQPNFINWSYRNRGKVARTQMKKKMKKKTLIKNQITGGKIGPCQPPK